MSQVGSDYRKFLDPRTLSKIEALELRARLVVEGYFSGMHRSPYQGFSVEFAEHRHYAPGDDLRHLDWKVFGRSDKRYIKQYAQETNLICMLVVDVSESMSYHSGQSELTKLEYATAAAAALAYLALQQHDSVGLAAFDEKITRFVRPTNHAGQWKTLIDELQRVDGRRKTSVRDVLDDLSDRLSRRTLVVLISDLFDDAPEVVRGLRHLRYRRHDVIVLQVLDPAELMFNFHGPTRFEGLEGTGKLAVDPASIRRRYLEEVDRFTETVRRSCRQMHVDYEVFNTADSLDLVLSTYLANRCARVG